jgi:hypothetical protein
VFGFVWHLQSIDGLVSFKVENRYININFVLVICRPFVGPLYCTIKNARLVTLIIYIIGVFYAGPLMYEYEPHQEKNVFDILDIDVNNKNMYRSKLTGFGSNSVFRWTYVLINALAVYIIPLIIIAILNRKLLRSIRLLEQRSAEYNAPLPTKQGNVLRKKKYFNIHSS